MSVNKVILIGRLGRDPETRYTGSGQQVCNFSMATDETFKDRAGAKQTKTEWHKIVAWGRLAEIIQQYVKKGSLIYVEGRLQTRQWDDPQGAKRTATEVVASAMKMLGGKNGNREPGEDQTPRRDFDGGPQITDDDIPL